MPHLCEAWGAIVGPLRGASLRTAFSRPQFYDAVCLGGC